jgi:DNA-binding MarR family transcriptional regulator
VGEDLYTQFDNIFFEKTRLSLVTVLYQEENASFNTLKRRLEASDGAVYTHLEKLVKAGYVDKRRQLAGEQVQTVYFLTEQGQRVFREYIAFIGDMLSSLHGTDSDTESERERKRKE